MTLRPQRLLAGMAIASLLAVAGALFLVAYGWRALQRARRPQQLQPGSGGGGPGRAAVLVQAAAFTLLNPHVYLDTVLLVGSVGAQQPDQDVLRRGQQPVQPAVEIGIGQGARRP